MSEDGFEKIQVHRGDDQIPRDRYGRYLLPHPETGKGQAWTRVTTLAGALKDRYGLERWDWRNIVWGMGQRPSLFAQAAAAKLTDTKTLDKIGDRAKEAADAHAGADLGSALHTFAERVDRGEEFEIAAPFEADIRAYRTALDMAGISTAVGWIERVICVPDLHVPESGVYGVCGTLDRVSNAMEWRLPRIGDIKSASDKEKPDGKVVDPITTYGMQDIPLQLAMYAHGTHWWDIANEQWVEMPPLDQETAMLYHIPAGLGQCRIYEIDIAAGWEAVKLALDIRAWRKRKGLYTMVLAINADGEIARGGAEAEQDDGDASSGESHRKGDEAGDSPAEDSPARPSSPPRGPIAQEVDRKRETLAQLGESVDRMNELYPDGMPDYLLDMPGVDDPLAPALPERVAWAQQRVNAIKAHSPEAATRLGQLWGIFKAVPLLPNAKNPDRTGPRTWGETSKLIGMLDLVEMEFQLPFPEGSDPSPDQPMPSPAERRRQREEKYNEEKVGKRKAAAKKAAATRAANKAAKGEQ